MIQPGAMLGVLGGGQLGRMFTIAAHQMGYQVTVLDPDVDSPAGRIADQFICADYADQTALQKMRVQCAAITTEFENIPAEILAQLAEVCPVSPDAQSVAIAQNRIAEKQYLQHNDFSVAPFTVIDRTTAIDLVQDLFPGILKVSQFGYDGKGQRQVGDQIGLRAAFAELGEVPCVLEKKLPLTCELSIVLARDANGGMESFPVIENQHVNGILDISIVPARIDTALARRADTMARRLADTLNYRGVLCVEFFVAQDGLLCINEIAPRPHNSGHFSVDACITSQFEQQVRTLCNLPLGNIILHQPCVMVNLLGDIWRGEVPDWTRILGQPSAKLHLYGKKEARPGRKMGHFTVMDETIENALANALHIRKSLTI
ncbi:MAG: 5-(carboxyamino)imidazole ribonucleotide synthase [Nitrosomonas sp.]|nr:5-(carboxyamino)imidazole ribonucleotide synthase [Nitrosomonas sp.]